MVFNSFHFLVFFIVVTSLYFAIGHKWRWALLLASSCYFYMAFVPIYIVILAITIVIDYFAGIYIEKSKGKRRKLFLICSLVANVGILAIFKYYNFINLNLSVLFERFDLNNPLPFLSILLPIGLSFHTFQAMSYTIEVYRGKQEAEKHFGIYSLYVMFYPQLVAGPIERPQNLLHQFREKHSFVYDDVTGGLKLMAWGLFKKVVVADRLAQVVNTVYAQPDDYNSVGLALATVFFAYQIYCDFSGYSDMAIGAARVMGFRLMTNFDTPYHSSSITEFWRRWHISLSTWFKDYVYIPLGGNRVAIPRWYINIFIVFLLSGLWHGASWTFIVWGALHGFYIVFGHVTEKSRNRISKLLWLDRVPLLSVITTFFLVCFAWIFFRAESMNSAWSIATRIFTGIPDIVNALLRSESVFQPYGTTYWELVLSFLVIILLEVIQIFDRYTNIRSWYNRSPLAVRWAGYYLLVFSILIFGVFEARQFIYFQF